MLNFPPGMWNGTPPFLPTSIANIYLWLDPNDSSTITQSGGTCSQINDKSGRGKNFTQVTAGKRPSVTASGINGLQVFTFATASAQGMDGTIGTISGTGWAFFALVYSTTNSHFNGIFVDYVNATDCSLELGTSNNLAVYVQATGDTAAGTSNTVNVNTPYWVGMTYDSAGAGTIKTYVNNVQTSSVTQGGVVRTINTSCGWGNNAAWGVGWQGKGGDLVGFNALPSLTDQGNLYTKFAKPKWNLP